MLHNLPPYMLTKTFGFWVDAMQCIKLSGNHFPCHWSRKLLHISTSKICILSLLSTHKTCRSAVPFCVYHLSFNEETFGILLPSSLPSSPLICSFQSAAHAIWDHFACLDLWGSDWWIGWLHGWSKEKEDEEEEEVGGGISAFLGCGARYNATTGCLHMI